MRGRRSGSGLITEMPFFLVFPYDDNDPYFGIMEAFRRGASTSRALIGPTEDRRFPVSALASRLESAMDRASLESPTTPATTIAGSTPVVINSSTDVLAAPFYFGTIAAPSLTTPTNINLSIGWTMSRLQDAAAVPTASDFQWRAGLTRGAGIGFLAFPHLITGLSVSLQNSLLTPSAGGVVVPGGTPVTGTTTFSITTATAGLSVDITAPGRTHAVTQALARIVGANLRKK